MSIVEKLSLYVNFVVSTMSSEAVNVRVCVALCAKKELLSQHVSHYLPLLDQCDWMGWYVLGHVRLCGLQSDPICM